MSTRRRFLMLATGALAACARAVRGGASPEPRESSAALPEPADTMFAGAPAPDDPLELLYARRLPFEGGQPLVTVRVVEGRREVVVSPRSPLTARVRTAAGELQSAVESGAPGRWTLRLENGTPATGAVWVELDAVRFGDAAAVAAARAEWEARGVPVRVVTVGEAYGISGHVVDTRRYALLAEGDATEAGARAQSLDLARRFGLRPQFHRELAVRPKGRIELRDPAGSLVAAGDSAIELRADGGLAVESVEYGMGYAFHGFEARTYPGRLYAVADASGALAVVAALPMERLVRGVVPSEIFANAPSEALKAQAVTARGEVFAKVGARHLGDPYLLCAEQHCQVYKGVAAELASTDAAVEATRGEALFAQKGGESRLVDSVYSAVCGGFTEDNDAVWGGPPDPALRGRPDFDPAAPAMAPFAAGIDEGLVERFVRLKGPPTYCALSGFARDDKVRWTRSFGQAEVDALCAHLGVGAVRALVVEGRGVSGRAKTLRVDGSSGTARVAGELPIRRLFRNLNSAMFVVTREAAGYTFTGGGWGHGSGMCQTGAIGRAQRGASYRDILAWYFSGARPVRIH